VAIWEDLLNIQPIGIHDSFFDLGGHSLLTVQLSMQIEQLLGQKIPLSTILTAPTIATLANLIQCPEPEEAVSDVVLLRAGGRKPPLFCLYGVLLYRELAQYLDADRPVYGVYLQAEVDLLKTGDLQQFQAMFSNVSAIADHYLNAIRQVQPCGPYYLAGESFGGVIAYEIAQKLQAAGEEVKLVAMMDSGAPNLQIQTSRIQRLQIHGQILLENGLMYLPELQQALWQRVMDLMDWLAPKLGLAAGRTQRNLQESTNATQAILPTPQVAEIDLRKIVREQACTAYWPLVYEGRTVLFRALERDPFEGDDPTLGWGLRVPNLQVFEVPGDHLSILKSPNVQIMAEQLRSYLDD
jgi:thioesterase domain-containing protein/acyl carrier protein